MKYTEELHRRLKDQVLGMRNFLAVTFSELEVAIRNVTGNTVSRSTLGSIANDQKFYKSRYITERIVSNIEEAYQNIVVNPPADPIVEPKQEDTFELSPELLPENILPKVEENSTEASLIASTSPIDISDAENIKELTALRSELQRAIHFYNATVKAIRHHGGLEIIGQDNDGTIALVKVSYNMEIR
jgi:hypothetical protein